MCVDQWVAVFDKEDFFSRNAIRIRRTDKFIVGSFSGLDARFGIKLPRNAINCENKSGPRQIWRQISSFPPKVESNKSGAAEGRRDLLRDKFSGIWILTGLCAKRRSPE